MGVMIDTVEMIGIDDGMTETMIDDRATETTVLEIETGTETDDEMTEDHLLLPKVPLPIETNEFRCLATINAPDAHRLHLLVPAGLLIRKMVMQRCQ
jgi:hypothetical protein